MEEFDHIVIGGGAAGCVAAARLVTDGNRTVLLLEAGHSHHHPLLDMPPGIFKMINGSKFMRYHQTVPQEHLARSRARHSAGQCAGRRLLGQRAGLHARPSVRLRRVGRAPARRQRRSRLGLERRAAAFPRHGGQQSAAATSCTAPTARCWSPIPAISTMCRAGSCRACRRWASPTPTTSTARRQRGVGFYQFMNRSGKRSSAAYAFIAPLEGRHAADRPAQRARCTRIDDRERRAPSASPIATAAGRSTRVRRRRDHPGGGLAGHAADPDAVRHRPCRRSSSSMASMRWPICRAWARTSSTIPRCR